MLVARDASHVASKERRTRSVSDDVLRATCHVRLHDFSGSPLAFFSRSNWMR